MKVEFLELKDKRHPPLRPSRHEVAKISRLDRLFRKWVVSQSEQSEHNLKPKVTRFETKCFPRMLYLTSVILKKSCVDTTPTCHALQSFLTCQAFIPFELEWIRSGLMTKHYYSNLVKPHGCRTLYFCEGLTGRTQRTQRGQWPCLKVLLWEHIKIIKLTNFTSSMSVSWFLTRSFYGLMQRLTGHRLREGRIFGTQRQKTSTFEAFTTWGGKNIQTW